MRKIAAILKKQCKDTMKNKTVLIQFIMFPFLAVIMQNAIHIEGMPENYFVNLFATMYVGMAPLTGMAEILSEEKEKSTLRVLLMSNVKAWEYLAGVGIYVFVCCMLGAGVFAAVGNYQGIDLAEFLGIMAAGILISALIGAVIGTFSKNQMAATSLTVPVMMIFSFLPMISMFNEKVAEISRFTFSQQVSNLMSAIGNMAVSIETILILLVNLAVALVLFITAYRRCSLA